MVKLYRSMLLRQEAHVIACIAFLRANWRACADAGEPLAVEIRQRGDKRSHEQNRRHWALLNEIASQAWIDGKQYDAETWHENFKRQFIGVEEIKLPGGETIQRGISTTALSVSEFGDYMTKIERYAAEELGVVL